MAAWPVTRYEAEVDYGRLFLHRPVPVHAYDLNGDLIAPDRFKDALARAIARVNFTLNHWFIENSSSWGATSQWLPNTPPNQHNYFLPKKSRRICVSFQLNAKT
jgi:hypothetical protein